MGVVLITGTSTGIGMATALAFGRAGHRVAATMRNPSRAPALGKAAEQEHLPITVFSMDVDVDASVRDGVARIVRDLGPIDVLVNNAGIERMGSVEELPLADFRAVMETNYFGVIRCTQAVLPAMRRGAVAASSTSPPSRDTSPWHRWPHTRPPNSRWKR